MIKPYNGVWPVAPSAFNSDGSIDLDGNKRVLECMIDQGVDGICILANFSEQFLLSDEELPRYLFHRYRYEIFPTANRLDNYPPYLQIEPSSICNYRCVFCYQTDEKFSEKSTSS